jgi:hypothetical protein
MWSTRWASYWLIYVTNGSIFVAKWPSSPRLSSLHGCPNQMWETDIVKKLLFAMSVVLTWLPQAIMKHFLLATSVSRHGCTDQIWLTGIMKQLLFSTSVVLTWLLQGYMSNRYHEDTCEWYFLPRLLSWPGYPNRTWATGTKGQFLYFNRLLVIKISIRYFVRDSLLAWKTVHCHWSSCKSWFTSIWLKQSTVHSFENKLWFWNIHSLLLIFSEFYSIVNSTHSEI